MLSLFRKSTSQLICSILSAVALSPARSQSTEISLPLNRAVYQRNSASQAQIPVAIQFTNTAGRTFSIVIEKTNVKSGLNPLPAAISNHNIPQNGLFQNTYVLYAGWYQLAVKVYGADESILETLSIKFGVGEVIFSAGQSNIQGIELGASGPPVLPGNPYDGLSVINQNCFCKRTFPFPIFEKMERGSNDTQKKIAPNGNQNIWCYEVIGRKLSDENGEIPVSFFNTASTGTTVSNWSESADNPNAITNSPWAINCDPNIVQWGSEGPEGHPYHSLKTALNYYGGMFGARTVVWHQGESDNLTGTTRESYQSHLINVIQRSRQHFHADLAWAISRVAHFPPHYNTTAVTEAQEYVRNNLSNTSWGAYYSDNFTGPSYRQSDDLHFNQNGLIALGSQIVSGAYDSYPTPPGYLSLTTLPPVEAMPVPSVVASESSGQYTLTVPGAYASYCWVQNEGAIKDCQFTTQSIVASNGKWRCYVTQAGATQRNISLTRSVILPLANFTPSLGISHSYGDDY